jgi:hypothetical protein
MKILIVNSKKFVEIFELPNPNTRKCDTRNNKELDRTLEGLFLP